MLRHKADRRTLAYAAAATALALLQWNAAQFHPVLFAASIVLAFAVSVMHHNHQHVPIWNNAILNHATDFWFTLFQGHPGFAFEPSHLESHHRHVNGEHDATRTWRGYDGNCLVGFVAHPMQFAARVAPLLAAYCARLWRQDRPRLALAAAHYAWLAGVVGTAFALDADKAVLFVVLPQLAALFFLLGSNYLQHAHADDRSRWNHSRNFLGAVNPLFFNVGYHTAHHEDAGAHWSELPAVHARIAPMIAPGLVERGLGAYVLRVFALAALQPRLRSRPMRAGNRP